MKRAGSRLPAVLGLACAGIVFGPWASPAGAAGPLLDPVDAEELAADLAEAYEVQGICYGWDVTVNDEQNSTTQQEYGSNFGANTRLDPSFGEHGGECSRYAMLVGRITYTSNSSEREDSADLSMSSNVPGARTIGLGPAGVAERDFLSSRDDVALINAVRALPMLMAEAGAAPPVPLEPFTDALPSGDRTTGRPGSDWIRTYRAALGLGAVLLVLGIGWMVVGWLRPTFLSDIKEAVQDAD